MSDTSNNAALVDAEHVTPHYLTLRRLHGVPLSIQQLGITGLGASDSIDTDTNRA